MRHTNNFATAIVLALGILLGATTALAESVRVAMPSKSLTFLNYYLADRFGLFKNEELEVRLPVGKADVQLAAVVSGEMNTSRPPERFFAAQLPACRSRR
jgi:ABC-type nitrate/sulfonate/bicarbonate transport system substrate-binding protein